MIGWVRRVVLRRTPPPDERSERAAQLDAAEREVQSQTAQIRRIRREARIAELRFKNR